MFITNMQHFLNKKGEIPETMPDEAKALAGFQAMVVDAATNNKTQTEPLLTDLRCFEKGCKGHVLVEIIAEENKIHWNCIACDMGGIISNWEGTKWDNFNVSDH